MMATPTVDVRVATVATVEAEVVVVAVVAVAVAVVTKMATAEATREVPPAWAVALDSSEPFFKLSTNFEILQG